MRRIIIVALLLCSIQDFSFAKGKQITKIVIDAGHGGKDGGARGQFSNEKDLTLAVALRVGKLITDSLKGVQVLYTRTSDVYPTLVERHEVANRANADLFVSIHVNSTAGRTERYVAGHRRIKRGRKYVSVPVYKTIHHRETSTTGTETYVLGLHRNSQKEGAIEDYGDNVTEEEGMLNENDPQTAIIISQYSQAFLGRSVSLAGKIQDQFAAQGRANLGVKQKGLEVLAGSAMPGVLVEIGFINNPSEETYLNSEAGQKQVAQAIFNGIRHYKVDAER
jgi:N-acetylmuramoyl-L-alanine amidase